jgi:TetR/AcrR family transcriptional regulator, transcriptional repressor of aconitase
LYDDAVPKVSQQYRDARREQILGAARRCFLRNGFHETSMQDLCAELGLSSGSVYRYFVSKEDVILAIAEENMRDVVAVIHALASERRDEGLGAALADVLRLVTKKHQEADLGPISLLVWSEAMRNPALRKRFETLVLQLRADLAEAVRGYQAEGALPADASPDALAALVSSIVPGFILQLALFGEDSMAGVADTVRGLWPGSSGSRLAGQ